MTSHGRKRACAVLVVASTLALFTASPAGAARTPAFQPVDQQQLSMTTQALHVLTGPGGHGLTQIITVGRTGTLIGVALPIGCAPGTVLSLDIQSVDRGLPSGTTLSTLSAPVTADFPTTPSAFWTFWLFPGVSLTAGQQVAINLALSSGSCQIASAGTGDPYKAGHAYEWGGVRWDPLPLDDLPFVTLVEAPVASTGALGDIVYTDAFYHYYLNTDNRSIDIYTSQGGYNVGPQVGRLVTQAGGGDAVVFDVATFNLGPGVLMDVVGSLGRPAVIAATGDITIAGTLRVGHGRPGGVAASASGSPAGTGGGGGGAGPGYYTTVWCGGFQCYEPLLGGGGGGGGGARSGFDGSPSNELVDVDGLAHVLAGGAGGPALVSREVLQGGSGGGAGADRPMWGGPATYGFGAGGTGGGGLAIFTPGNLAIAGAGRLDASGAPGIASSGGGGGGGGAGGYLLLKAGGQLSVALGGVVAAAGGAGGAGPAEPQADSLGGAGGGGRILYRAGSADIAGTMNAGTGTVERAVDLSGLVTDLEGKAVANIPVRLTGLSAGVALTDADGRYAFPSVLNPASHTVKPQLTDFTFSPVSAVPSLLVTSADFVVTEGVFRRYLAEGATHSGFDVELALLNCTDVPTQALLHFLTPQGPVSSILLVPAHSQRTLHPKTAVPGLSSTDFSTVLESDVPLTLDRTMTWDARSYGAHAESSVGGPASTWYLAEGATHSGFDLYYLVQNPTNELVTVEIEWLLPRTFVPPPGFEPIYRKDVPAMSRATIAVDLIPGLSNTDVSAIVRSPAHRPVIVERAMYHSRTRWFESGHDSVGVTAPRPSWFFAEGATHSGFALYLLVANPNDTEADVEFRYLLRNGTTITVTSSEDPRLRLPAKSRLTIYVPWHDARLAAADVSTVVRETRGRGIIAERAMWWPGNYLTWTEAHNAAGATATGTAWALAGGYVGGPNDASTFVLVANTSVFAADVRATLFFENGATASTQITVPANSRANFNLAPETIAGYPGLGASFTLAEIGAGKRFGVRIDSLPTASGTAQIVVERAMYWNAEGVRWAAGTDVVATRLH